MFHLQKRSRVSVHLKGAPLVSRGHKTLLGPQLTHMIALLQPWHYLRPVSLIVVLSLFLSVSVFSLFSFSIPAHLGLGSDGMTGTWVLTSLYLRCSVGLCQSAGEQQGRP